MLNVSVSSVKRAKNGGDEKKPRNKPNAERVAEIRALAADGNRSEQIGEAIGMSDKRVREIAREASISLPDDVIRSKGRLNVRRVIESTVQGLEGGNIPLKAIKGSAFVGITAEEARLWADSLGESIKVLNWLRKELGVFANGNE